MIRRIIIEIKEKDGIGDLSVDATGFTAHEAIGALEHAKLHLLKMTIEHAKLVLSKKHFDESSTEEEPSV